MQTMLAAWACKDSWPGERVTLLNSAHKLPTALNAISEAQYSILHSEFLMELWVAMARSGDISEGLSAIEKAVRRSPATRPPIFKSVKSAI